MTTHDKYYVTWSDPAVLYPTDPYPADRYPAAACGQPGGQLSLSALVVGVLTLIAAACGSSQADASADPPLSLEASEGRGIFASGGCAACHGGDAGGGIGPTLRGLAGTEVQLDDDTTVVADGAYLTESIQDPSAKQVAGYTISMPPNGLSDTEVSAVVAYLKELPE